MRILVHSVNGLFGQCLCHGLAGQPGVDFVRHSKDAEETVRLARRHHVSAVLADLASENGTEVLRAFSLALSNTRIIALSVDDRAAPAVIECARLGCHGIVPRDAELNDVIQIVQAAERGEANLRPDMVAELMQALAGGEATEPEGLPECLTRREKEICKLLCEGLTNKEIAREINRSAGTVKNHVRSILSKLRISRRGAVHSCLSQAGHRRMAGGPV
jgi:two-component system nitrate/nitrite response regulator NarL